MCFILSTVFNVSPWLSKTTTSNPAPTPYKCVLSHLQISPAARLDSVTTWIYIFFSPRLTLFFFGAPQIAAGTCSAYMQDSTLVLAGLTQVKTLAPILVSPYGIAIAKNQTLMFAALTAFSTIIESNGPASILAQVGSMFRSVRD